MSEKKFNILVCAAIVALHCCSGFVSRASAADYPSRTMELSVVFTPGGALDVISRALAAGMEDLLGQKFVIRNNPGGGGMPGVARLAVASPDGYNLGTCVSNALIFIPHRNEAPYLPLKDVEPVAAFGQATPVLIVRPDSDWNNMEEFLAASEKRRTNDEGGTNDKEIRIGIPGLGTPTHIALAMIARERNISWSFIPYGGPGEAEAALMGGHIEAAASGVLPRILDGQFRPLAALGGERVPALGHIPSLPDLGFGNPGMGDSVFLLLAPAGTPEEVLETLENACLNAAKSETFLDTMKKFSVSPLLYDRQQSQDFLENAWQKETEILKALGLGEKPATSPR